GPTVRAAEEGVEGSPLSDGGSKALVPPAARPLHRGGEAAALLLLRRVEPADPASHARRGGGHARERGGHELRIRVPARDVFERSHPRRRAPWGEVESLGGRLAAQLDL